MNQLQSLIISLQTKEMLLSANQQFACHRNWGSDAAFTHIVFIEKLEETILNASGKDLPSSRVAYKRLPATTGDE